MHSRAILAGLIAISAIVETGAARSPQSVRIGQLSCDATTTSRSIHEKDHPVQCVFYTKRKAHRFYIGIVKEARRDIAKVLPTIMRWDVYSSDPATYKGLTGTYHPAGPKAATGKVSGSHVLTSRGDSSVFLRPVLDQAGQGVNFADDVSVFRIKWAERH